MPVQLGLTDRGKNMILDKNTLEHQFVGLQRVEQSNYPHHFLLNNKFGSTVAQIVWLNNNELRVEIDNFPHDKKYFSSNIPVRTQKEFISDMERIGLFLKRKE